MDDALVVLRRFVAERYSFDEFRTLCFDLGVRYAGLAGEGPDAKARELILHLWRQGRLADLLAILEESRPGAFTQLGLNLDPTPFEETLALTYSALPATEPLAPSESDQGDRRWQMILRVIAVLSWIVAVVWMLVEPSFEPLLAVLVGVVSLVTSFLIGAGTDSSSRQKQEASARNRHIRTGLLEKVRVIWIRSVLEDDLFETTRIELGLAFRPEAVERPWVLQLERSSQPTRLLPKTTKVTDVFCELGGAMLILGNPGSGKTFTLLELARDLLEASEHDTYRPIPLIFNLSSWAREGLPLLDWLAQELNIIYGVSNKYAADWLRQMPFQLLLDGLDEVKEDKRGECVIAINRFRKENGFTNLVVCSRTAEYERLSKRLQLMGAIVIQPLTSRQIDAYLAIGGEQLAAARATVSTDEPLRELTQTPLILNVIALTYRDREIGDLTSGTMEERRRLLFASYVDRMFKRRGGLKDQEQAISYLSWLASHMQERAQSVFYIERLQPECLDDKERRYRLCTGLIGGLVAGLISGLVVGLLGGLIGKRVSGLDVGLFVGLLGGLAVGLISGLVVGSGEIDLVEELEFSWKRGVKGLFADVRRRLVIGMVIGLVIGLVVGLYIGLGAGLYIGLVFGLVGFLILGLDEALYYREIQIRVFPNQGIRLSGRNLLRGALILGLFGGFIGGLIGVPLNVLGDLLEDGQLHTPLVPVLVVGLNGGFLYGLFSGLVLGFLAYGGATVIKHSILRLFLARYKYLPLRLIEFLDAMAARIILRKVGGGYIFIHRMLLDYFASLEDEIQ